MTTFADIQARIESIKKHQAEQVDTIAQLQNDVQATVGSGTDPSPIATDDQLDSLLADLDVIDLATQSATESVANADELLRGNGPRSSAPGNGTNPPPKA